MNANDKNIGTDPCWADWALLRLPARLGAANAASHYSGNPRGNRQVSMTSARSHGGNR
jgi:hypothetical protein